MEKNVLNRYSEMYPFGFTPSGYGFEGKTLLRLYKLFVQMQEVLNWVLFADVNETQLCSLAFEAYESAYMAASEGGKYEDTVPPKALFFQVLKKKLERAKLRYTSPDDDETWEGYPSLWEGGIEALGF